MKSNVALIVYDTLIYIVHAKRKIFGFMIDIMKTSYEKMQIFNFLIERFFLELWFCIKTYIRGHPKKIVP